MPKEAEIESSIELRCEWQLSGGSGLYSVKWYKDDHEFFRYVSDDNPEIQTFLQPGINIHKRERNEEETIGLRVRYQPFNFYQQMRGKYPKKRHRLSLFGTP
ncbi:hypothetical protein ANTPLA_LOCUS10455 [Anthophora plagiata]